MTTTTETKIKGGSWLFDDEPGEVFTPERLSDEHRMMAQTTEEFVAAEIMPALPRLEAKDWDLARALLRKCGELGLLGLGAPEQYGGLDLDKVSSLVVVERIARSASFATDVRRSGQPERAAHLPLRHRGAKGQVPAASAQRRDRRRLRAQRGRIGV
jgi:alkylation response protein AidB-like acyl-CoA dehydrogenase